VGSGVAPQTLSLAVLLVRRHRVAQKVRCDARAPTRHGPLNIRLRDFRPTYVCSWMSEAILVDWLALQTSGTGCM
jgi:hypothetical protein